MELQAKSTNLLKLKSANHNFIQTNNGSDSLLLEYFNSHKRKVTIVSQDRSATVSDDDSDSPVLEFTNNQYL